MARHRVFSGARPTGRQHLGNYLGAIQNYVTLQEGYDCVYSIVDIHSLTTLEDTTQLRENTIEMAVDWLAAGIDPQKSIVFVQSHVPEVLELSALLGMVTPLGWLLRVPTFKEKARMQPHNVNYGLVGYPVLMTADIVVYKADTIPVGEDPLPHLEIAREIVRRFNSLFGQTFPEPQAKLTSFPLVPGLDGTAKMSKSYGSQIELGATPEDTFQKVRAAVTDVERRYRSDVGHPDKCNVFRLHQFFNKVRLDEIAAECMGARIGCVDCKGILAKAINAELAPLRARRKELLDKPSYVAEILADGVCRAQVIARATLQEVKDKMGLMRRALP